MLDSLPYYALNTRVQRLEAKRVNGHTYYRIVLRKVLAVIDTITLGPVRFDCFSPDDIHNLKEDFDEIWENLFPLPEAEIVEQSSSALADILKWIGSARIRKELAEVLGEVENFVREGINQIVDYKVKTLVTTLGPTVERHATLYFIDSLDVSMFDSIVLKDNDLIFHAGSDPGYKNICIVGPGQMHRIARIIKYGKGKYIAKFSDITIKPEGCFVHLY